MLNWNIKSRFRVEIKPLEPGSSYSDDLIIELSFSSNFELVPIVGAECYGLSFPRHPITINSVSIDSESNTYNVRTDSLWEGSLWSIMEEAGFERDEHYDRETNTWIGPAAEWFRTLLEQCGISSEYLEYNGWRIWAYKPSNLLA